MMKNFELASSKLQEEIEKEKKESKDGEPKEDPEVNLSTYPRKLNNNKWKNLLDSKKSFKLKNIIKLLLLIQHKPYLYQLKIQVFRIR